MFTINNHTTVDYIIEHLIKRLNTDFLGAYIEINQFCHHDNSKGSHDYDQKMASLVLDKMLTYDVAEKAKHGFDSVVLRPNGIKAEMAGGWKNYLLEVEKIEAEKVKRSSRHNINVGGNAVIGDNNSNNHLDSSFRFDMKSKNAIQQIPIETPNTKSSHDIWDKIKYISVITGGIAALVAAISKLLNVW
jgi:hypothetical protein